MLEDAQAEVAAIEIRGELPTSVMLPLQGRSPDGQNTRSPEIVEPAMMVSLHEDQRVGATAGVRDWASKPTAATAERVPSSGEPHSASAAAQAIAIDRFAEMYAGRNRKTDRPKSAGTSRLCGETGHDSGMVPATDRAEI